MKSLPKISSITLAAVLLMLCSSACVHEKPDIPPPSSTSKVTSTTEPATSVTDTLASETSETKTSDVSETTAAQETSASTDPMSTFVNFKIYERPDDYAEVLDVTRDENWVWVKHKYTTERFIFGDGGSIGYDIYMNISSVVADADEKYIIDYSTYIPEELKEGFREYANTGSYIISSDFVTYDTSREFSDLAFDITKNNSALPITIDWKGYLDSCMPGDVITDDTISCDKGDYGFDFTLRHSNGVKEQITEVNGCPEYTVCLPLGANLASYIDCFKICPKDIDCYYLKYKDFLDEDYYTISAPDASYFDVETCDSAVMQEWYDAVDVENNEVTLPLPYTLNTEKAKASAVESLEAARRGREQFTRVEFKEPSGKATQIVNDGYLHMYSAKLYLDMLELVYFDDKYWALIPINGNGDGSAPFLDVKSVSGYVDYTVYDIDRSHSALPRKEYEPDANRWLCFEVSGPGDYKVTVHYNSMSSDTETITISDELYNAAINN